MSEVFVLMVVLWHYSHTSYSVHLYFRQHARACLFLSDMQATHALSRIKMRIVSRAIISKQH